MPDLWRNKGRLQGPAPIKGIKQIKERYTQRTLRKPKRSSDYSIIRCHSDFIIGGF